jgi:hypothetical protein
VVPSDQPIKCITAIHHTLAREIGIMSHSLPVSMVESVLGENKARAQLHG